MQTRAPPGTPGAPTESTMIETMIVVRALPVMGRPKIFAIKSAVIISEMQEPSMLMVAPRGSENE